LANLPKSSTTSDYLVRRASSLYDTQLRLEDALIALRPVTTDAAHAEGCKAVVKHLQNALPWLIAEIGTLTLAAR
jgi:hypothetical protein